MPGHKRCFLSSNRNVSKDDQLDYPEEVIGSMNPSGFPPHKLLLAKHAGVMLIRNIDPLNGHVNGARYR